jgi:hypothetical protein
MAHVIGITFGFSQFVQYGVFGTLFYFGAIFIEDEMKAMDPLNISTEPATRIFTALFAMMFAAMGSA